MPSKIALKTHHCSFYREFPGGPLTLEQVDWLQRAVGLYITLHQDYLERLPTSADADHSSLLHRLLSGKTPTKYPPPLVYSYPWYEIAEAEDSGEPFSCELRDNIHVWPERSWDDWYEFGVNSDGVRLLKHDRLRGTYRIEPATVHLSRQASTGRVIEEDGYRLTRVDLPPE